MASLLYCSPYSYRSANYRYRERALTNTNTIVVKAKVVRAKKRSKDIIQKLRQRAITLEGAYLKVPYCYHNIGK